MQASPARPCSNRPASTSNTTRSYSVPARGGSLSREITGATSSQVPNPTLINTASIRNKAFISAAPILFALKPILTPLQPRNSAITPTTTSTTTTARVSPPKQPISAGISRLPRATNMKSKMAPSVFLSNPTSAVTIKAAFSTSAIFPTRVSLSTSAYARKTTATLALAWCPAPGLPWRFAMERDFGETRVTAFFMVRESRSLDSIKL